MAGSLEIPLDSLQVALQAAPHADRLELCHDLPSEGWSPSPELVREVRHATPCEVVAMIRPRVPGMPTTLDAASFVGTPAFRAACRADIEAFADAGAHSVAIGMLDDLGDIDLEGCHQLHEAAWRRGLRTSFHRAFDLLVDRDRGWRDAMALGLCRVLTAGVHGWDAAVTPLSRGPAPPRACRPGRTQPHARRRGTPGGGLRWRAGRQRGGLARCHPASARLVPGRWRVRGGRGDVAARLHPVTVGPIVEARRAASMQRRGSIHAHHLRTSTAAALRAGAARPVHGTIRPRVEGFGQGSGALQHRWHHGLGGRRQGQGSLQHPWRSRVRGCRAGTDDLQLPQ
ncbi:MAG: hypothetical protein EBQ99_02100 [Planctomycetes bacterium]|nr:hypothetical protein [Planctomycetota bacterium]